MGTHTPSATMQMAPGAYFHLHDGTLRGPVFTCIRIPMYLCIAPLKIVYN